MKNTAPAIKIDSLAVRYGELRVIDCFDLQVARGERVIMTGPSGSGKSTVLKCIMGLAIPREGSISILGHTLDGRRVWEARRSLAYVGQEPDLGSGTTREAIERPFGYRANQGLRENLQRLPALLERFNLPQTLLDKEIPTLSGGEKQRMALVSAILLERPIILLDEASSALDKTNREAVVDYFRQAADLTVLSVSHDAEWLAFSARVMNLAAPGHGREERK